MSGTEFTLPVIDLHCDLLMYLNRVPGASVYEGEGIGATLPHLQAGNVRVQVTAIFTTTAAGSTELARQQAEHFRRLTACPEFIAVVDSSTLSRAIEGEAIGLLPAIENASGLCEEEGAVETGFNNLEKLLDRLGRIFYISLTHHLENRFGGGNYCQGTGLKADGEALIQYLDGRKIAIDLSHSSDALASDVLNYIDRRGLQVPVIASHSNFRKVWKHDRNLPEEIADELIRRRSLIGINFLRAYLDNEDPARIYDHIRYAWGKGGVNSLAFGADFFYTPDFPDPSRKPLFFDEHENAGAYPRILQHLAGSASLTQLEALAFSNAQHFLEQLWQNETVHKRGEREKG